jgi:hypothetical protein
MKKIIYDLCGGSGAWSKPYRDAGYDVRVITLPEYDVRDFQPQQAYGVLAAPPCTEFSLVKSEKLSRDIPGAMEIVNACLRIIEQAAPKFWALENPVGHLVKFLGKPNFVFQPWEFGDPWTKRTGIWGNFQHPDKTYTDWEDVPKNPALYIRKPRKKPNMVWLHKSAYKNIPAYHGLTEPDTDAAFRAMTPQGFAQAFFLANT